MPQSTYKLISVERSLATNTNVLESSLVRIYCTGPTTGANSVLHFANTGGEYANMTLVVGQDYIVKIYPNDTLQGNNMLAVAMAYMY